MIADERVTINGELATLGSRVAEGDKVKIDGEPLHFIPMEQREYKLRRYGSSPVSYTHLVIGDLDRLPSDVKARLLNCIRDTSGGERIVLNLALSYSSRWEIARAARCIAQEVQKGRLSVDDITETTVDEFMTTVSMPNPDLLIRTGGEIRLSNFLLWQLSYAEFYFTEEYWPDFTEMCIRDRC